MAALRGSNRVSGTAPKKYEHPFLGYKNGEGEGAAILPLVLQMECTATRTEMNDNVKATLRRGYASFTELLDVVSGGPVSLCGAGPSLLHTLHHLKGDVFAVNSAIPLLLKQGIVPKWAMIWDCADICEAFAEPHPDVTYLIASRCHEKVFEKLRGCKVYVWHADGDMNIVELLNENGVNEPLIKGGTTGITRGIYVAYALGYRHFHLFGADSCYVNGKSHVNGSLVYEHVLDVMVNGRWFKSTAQWAAQIEELKIMYPMFKHTQLRADMTAYDEGLFQFVLDIMKSDEERALANALAALELQQKQKGAAAPGVPGVMPEGSIAEIAKQHPEIAAPVMKTLQPLEAGANNV